MTTSYDELTEDEWQLHCWTREWLRLWDQIGLAEEQWVLLYLPFMPRVSPCRAATKPAPGAPGTTGRG